MKIGRDGRFSLSNISGDIIGHRRIGRRGVDRGGQADARRQERAGARADHRRRSRRARRRPDRARTEPDATGTARRSRIGRLHRDACRRRRRSIVHSVSGSIKVTGVHGSLRGGDGQRRRDDHRRAASSRPPRPCRATCTLTGVTADGDLTATQRQRQRARQGAEGARPGSRLGQRRHQRQRRRRASAWASRSVSGSVEYAGGIARAAATRSTRTRAPCGWCSPTRPASS